MAEIELPADFKEFLKLLNEHRVEYLIIGGYAVAYHGYPRATGDIDIWVALHPRNAERIVAALKNFGFDVPELAPDLFLKEDQIMHGRTTPSNRDRNHDLWRRFRRVLRRPGCRRG